MKTRKTVDMFELHVNYGQGYEHEISEYTRTEIKQRLAEYRENCPQYHAKSKKVRVKKADLEAEEVTAILKAQHDERQKRWVNKQLK